MANTYNGPVELIDEQGNAIESGVPAQLASRIERSGLPSWTGTLGPVVEDVSDWKTARRVRLPSGDEGDIIPRNVEVSSNASGVRKVAHLHGSGTPPF